MQRYFVTATGTDIGKTFITSALTWQLRQRGLHACALKPVISGFCPATPENSDSAQLLTAQGLTLSALEDISPWRFQLPLSVDIAAKKEGKILQLQEVVDFSNNAMSGDVAFIEGAGGVMSPLTEQHTMLDWMEAMALPVILVTGSYLGTLSHTLTALHVLLHAGLTVPHIIINESPDSPMLLEETKTLLERHIPKNIQLTLMPRLDSGKEMWKNAPTFSERFA